MRANQQVSNIAIVLVVAIVVVFVGQYLLNRFLNAMLLNKLVPFIQESEGGLSRDPKDSASSNPAPWTHKGVSGWHTNKGITYSTFVSNASRLGYAPTADNFFNMPDDIWLKILKGAYMKPFPLDKISHLPRIQAVIITWAWGSGVGGATTRLANFQREVMGIKDSNITANEIVDNFRKHINPINEREWFQKLCDRREQDFRKMPTFSAHGKGWLNRLAKFRQLFN